MVRDPKAVKRPYIAPAFEIVDADAARAALNVRGDATDPNVLQMLSLIDEQREGKTRSILKTHSPSIASSTVRWSSGSFIRNSLHDETRKYSMESRHAGMVLRQMRPHFRPFQGTGCALRTGTIRMQLPFSKLA